MLDPAAAHMTDDQIEMRRRTQRILAWSGPVMIGLFMFSWIVLARFIPPPDPGRSAEHVVAALSNNVDATRAGLVLSMLASALLVPFAALISSHIRRIEGYGGGALATTQVTSGAVVSLEFIIPILVWLTALYRVDLGADPEIIRTLNDMSWIMFVTVIASIEVQILTIAAAVFIDRRSKPVFPRWYGYFNVWVAITFLPAGAVAFFHDGAMVWGGVVGFFLPATAFAVWMIVTFFVLRRAIDEQAIEATPVSDPAFDTRDAVLAP
jgi:hypothetical protein